MCQYSLAMQPDRPRYVIDRLAYNLPDFDKEFDKKSRQFPVGEKVKKLLRYRTAISSTQSTLNPRVFPSHTLSASDKLLCCDQIGGEPCSYDFMRFRNMYCGLFQSNNQKNLSASKEFLLFVSVRCSATRLRGLLFRHLPALSWLPKYKAKENLLCDVISGVSAGTIQVPQGRSSLLLSLL